MHSKKGFSLIEVLISITIFAIFFLSAVTIYSQSTLKAKEQKAYTYFESICLDIDKYYDQYDSDWVNKYYAGKTITDNTIYYDEDFNISNIDNAVYCVVYKYENNNLIVNCKYYTTNKIIIEDLNYGQSKASK